MDTNTHGFPRKPPVFSLTEEEKKVFRAFFSRYSPGRLTAEQAKDILKALEEAGISGFSAMGVLGEAGMDALEVWSIAHGGMIFPMLRSVRRTPRAPKKESEDTPRVEG